MDKISKKRQSSNSVRLESIKRKQQEVKLQNKLISTSLQNADSHGSQNTKIIFDDDDSDNVESSNANKTEKNILFNSSESESDDKNDDDRFKIKKQFEGSKGQQLLEMSSKFTDDRFRLDERFQESDESDEASEIEADTLQDEKSDVLSEQQKNLEILEQVLGFQVPKKHSKRNSDLKNSNPKRKYMRFDPERENAAEFIKENETDINTKEIKKAKVQEIPESKPEPVVSKERFFEVKANLKEIIEKNDSGFSLLKKFDAEGKLIRNDAENSEHVPLKRIEKSSSSNISSVSSEKQDRSIPPKPLQNNFVASGSFPCLKKSTFFIGPNDSRLKEGIEFFRRTKSMEEIKEQWSKIKEELLEMHKKRWKLARKNQTTRVKHSKKNYKKR